MEMHEFWLTYENAGNPIYRVALGSPIPSLERKTLCADSWKNPERNNKSGSIGFMDVMRRTREIPKDDTVESILSYLYQPEDTLTVLAIGIEPNHRNQGYASFLITYAEETLAPRWNLTTVVWDTITNPLITLLARRRGYTLFYDGIHAFKRNDCSLQNKKALRA